MSERTGTKSPGRLFYLDNLRVYLTILVILHHTAIAYGGAGDWPVVDPAVDDISPIFLTFFTAVNQTYFMSAFFLLAGYFTPRSYEEKGGSVFIKDRLIRLGIPLLFYSTAIVNINVYLSDVYLRGEPFSPILVYSPGHLWFLQALIIFAIIYTVYRSFADRNPSKKLFQYSQSRFPSNHVLILSIIILAVLTFIVRLKFPVGVWFTGLQLGHFVHYIFSFFVGILAQRGNWFDRLGRSQARRWGIVSLITVFLFFPIVILGGVLESPENLSMFLGGMNWQALVTAVWDTVLFIGIMVFLLYFFRERFGKAGPLLRSMAANVYTVYIVHQTVLFGMNIVFLSVDIPTILKFFIVAFITVPLCFALSSLIRKIPYTKRVLG